jgi:hypothetical protein
MVRPPSIRAGVALRVQVRTPEAGRPYEAVRDVARAAATPELPAAVQLRLSTYGAQLSALSVRADLSPAALPAVPWVSLQLRGPVQAQTPGWPRLPGSPQARTSVATRIAALSNLPLSLIQPCTLARSPASEPSGVMSPPAAHPLPPMAPPPISPRQPADRSTSTGQVRDSGGSNAPAMGTVSSSWWGEVVAVGRRLGTDLSACGRTVRYAGPPS